MYDISIILCGRNDNQNGDFESRCLAAMKHNKALMNGGNLRVEWVYVEWNPIPDRPLLADSLVKLIPRLRSFVVGSDIHEKISTNPHLGMLQFFAKNLGLRKASADWCLVVNADTWLTPNIVASLSGLSSFDSNTLYLANRRDVAMDYLADGVDRTPIWEWNVVNPNTVSPPHDFGPCGDFMLMHINLMQKTGSYFEGVTFSNCHIDLLFCYQVLALDGVIDYLGDVYHVVHKDSFNHFNGSNQRHHHGWFYSWQHVKIPYQNQADWGFVKVSTKCVGANVHLLEDVAQSSLLEAGEDASLMIYRDYWRLFCDALNALRESRMPVLIYGYGEEARRAKREGLLDDVDIIAIVDDGRCDGLDWPSISPDSAGEYPDASILVGSAWWSLDIAERAEELGIKAKLFPETLRSARKFALRKFAN